MYINMKFLIVATCFVATVSAQNRGNGRINDNNSFKPPFDTYTGNGNRVIEGWIVGGDATINQVCCSRAQRNILQNTHIHARTHHRITFVSRKIERVKEVGCTIRFPHPHQIGRWS
jgi:hypothetical protein